MEPSDLKSPAPDRDPLETWLRAGVAPTPLPDNGFSHRVLTSLPPRIPPARARRVICCVIGAAAGATFPLLAGPGLSQPTDGIAELNRAAQAVLVQFHNPTIALALVVSGLSLLYVFKLSGRHLLRP